MGKDGAIVGRITPTKWLSVARRLKNTVIVVTLYRLLTAMRAVTSS